MKIIRRINKYVDTVKITLSQNITGLINSKTYERVARDRTVTWMVKFSQEMFPTDQEMQMAARKSIIQ